MKKKCFKKLLVLVAVIHLTLAVFPSGIVHAKEESGRIPDYLESVMDMIKEMYNGNVTDEQLLEGAMKGIFNAMDPYTTYFTKEEAETFMNNISGSYEGIGVSFIKEGNFITVVKVFPSSPAEKAGIMPGDKIITVDGKNITGVSTEEVSNLIKGEVGTKVRLGIMRNAGTELINVEVERAVIKLSPVTYEIKGDIGYIKLETFGTNASEFMDEALGEIDKMGINKIILDLRDNPGGEVEQSIKIARRFVPRGLIAKLDFKSDGIQDEEYYSYLDNLKYKLVVLVNGLTASAAEILAGAVQDTGAGVVIGTNTFGKSAVQSLFPLLSPESQEKYRLRLGRKIVNAYDLYNFRRTPKWDEIIGFVKITTGMFITPSGKVIDGEGLSPDITVDDSESVDGINIREINKLNKVSKPGLNDESQDVYNAEKILKLLGYDVDTPDIRLDQKTFDAIRKFQAENKLYPCGVLDFTTQNLLNAKLDELVGKLDKQYATAVEVLRYWVDN